DRRLSGNLVHELCHGRPQAAPWTILEAAALYLGALARPEHIFPDEPGEAIPGVSLFVLIGEALARILGPAWLGAALLGRPGAGALAEAGWQKWRRERTAPFVVDALDWEAWVKLADFGRAAAPAGDDLLGAAVRRPWSELPWFAEEPTDADREMVATGVRALF